jgi:hypothetical protein
MVQFQENTQLSSAYIKTLNAPPLALLLMDRTASTHDFIAFGAGRAFSSRRRARRIRVSGEWMTISAKCAVRRSWKARTHSNVTEIGKRAEHRSVSDSD